MTRLELLMIAVGRARTNGFEFRRWYTTRLDLPWISVEASLALLAQQRRYYALLFSHEFAIAFWKAGEDITFSVPETSFLRHMPNGSIQTIHRKAFTRRSGRRDAWLYHLRNMAAAEDPLRYIRKYLQVDEDLTDELAAALLEHPPAPKPRVASPRSSRHTKSLSRPIPTDTPDFLRRPYVP